MLFVWPMTLVRVKTMCGDLIAYFSGQHCVWCTRILARNKFVTRAKVAQAWSVIITMFLCASPALSWARVPTTVPLFCLFRLSPGPGIVFLQSSHVGRICQAMSTERLVHRAGGAAGDLVKAAAMVIALLILTLAILEM